MSQTPFTDLGSQDILSAHLSGVQHAIGNIESVLNMKTAVVTGAPLTPVADQVDASLRYLIYEGAIRNWLGTPTPVIKRGGAIVNPSEYTIYPAYGAIVFAAQQQSSAVITADVTYVTNGSNVIDTVNANAASIAALNALSLLAKHYVGQYRSHGISPQGGATGISVLNNTMDIFPFRVYEDMYVDNMGVHCTTLFAGSLVALAIYTDNNGYPGNLIAQTGQLDTGTTGWKEGPFTTGNQHLTPGLYWIARWNNTNAGSPAFAGLPSSAINPVPSAPSYLTAVPTYVAGTGGGGVGGVRYTYTWATNFPSTIPAIGASVIWLDRTTYASPWVRRYS